MQPAALFETISQQNDPEPRIDLHRKDTGAKITLDAASLIAQYILSSGDMILVLDEDCSYEEQLHLVLVRDAAILDHLVIGAPFASGIYRQIELGDDVLAFGFSGDSDYVLGVREGWFFRRSLLPAGVRRQGLWSSPQQLTLSVRQPS